MTANGREVVVLSGVRTAIGNFGGRRKRPSQMLCCYSLNSDNPFSPMVTCYFLLLATFTG
jgi:hypothetical protein